MADSHVVVRTGFAASNPRQQLYQVFRLRPDGAYYPVDDKQNDPVQFDKAFARRTQYMKEPEG